MKKIACLIIWVLLVSGAGIQPASARAWQAKIDAALLAPADDEPIEFLVYLKEQADLSPARGLKTKAEKGHFVYERLSELARRSQAGLVRLLEQRGVEYRTYWVVNMIWVRGEVALLQMLAQRNEVAKIFANPWVKQVDGLVEQPREVKTYMQANLPQDHIHMSWRGGRWVPDEAMITGLPWNISQIHAPEAWAMGYSGQGVVIGGQDTGYEWTHPALKRQYRGWNGTTADHNYNWHDAIHAGSSSCGVDSLVPCDDYGHGTHTMGTMVGDDGQGNQVGVAPGARWIGCRNMRNGYGSPATYTECYQWFIAPTNLQGHEPRIDLAPDVINNSWSCPDSEGCSDPEVLRQVVENVRAAGILTVHSAGNSGPGCSTINDPATIYEASFSVGATNEMDQIASFSSRGPVSVDGSGRLKPNVSAPGVAILSTYKGGGYSTMSGTSMAAPHVAGIVALVLSAYPERAGNVPALENLIEQTAVPIQTDEDCGGTAGKIPNNTYGWGRVDALRAVQGHWLDIDMSVEPEIAAPGDILTYTLTITHSHPSSPTWNLVVTDKIPSDTTFIDADQPYTLNEDLLQWEKASLEARGTWIIRMRVQIDANAPKWILNEIYGVKSDETPQVVYGHPVSTKAALIFLPAIFSADIIIP